MASFVGLLAGGPDKSRTRIDREAFSRSASSVTTEESRLRIGGWDVGHPLLNAGNGDFYLAGQYCQKIDTGG